MNTAPRTVCEYDVRFRVRRPNGFLEALQGAEFAPAHPAGGVQTLMAVCLIIVSRVDECFPVFRTEPRLKFQPMFFAEGLSFVYMEHKEHFIALCT